MKTSNKLVKALKIFIIVLIVGFLAISPFYAYWNSAPAEQTCAVCHEISNSVHVLANSAHRELLCKECHGTALSNGVHSIKEKSMMFVNHIRGINTDNIIMGESQILEVMNTCRRCHSSEYAKWESGGHSATYGYILLDSIQNSNELLNYDCLRCHGMYFEGTVADLVEPISMDGPWQLVNANRNDLPTIPCMACHMIHTDGDLTSSILTENYYWDSLRTIPLHSPGLSFYVRSEKENYTVDLLPAYNIYDDSLMVVVSDDPIMRNCIQCHAPNSRHEAGTGDDRTPRGVHEGLSCTVCHEPHSNNAQNSCIKCHPAISNCQIDVTQMNTTYKYKDSHNNIHFVSCNDCHENGRGVK